MLQLRSRQIRIVALVYQKLISLALVDCRSTFKFCCEELFNEASTDEWLFIHDDDEGGDCDLGTEDRHI
ncbi:hypothetical protein BpHYR1_045442 [Brachionus plicatilis]|uniref:Uncharacterized protein n=1 Tax=Brachionus plicatilis TaxID=10195 RepID=A0A3M7PI85_BRAPC|nr:hypothetical protein BpHYR1_045442 [Brachionus plicatilis]